MIVVSTLLGSGFVSVTAGEGGGGRAVAEVNGRLVGDDRRLDDVGVGVRVGHGGNAVRVAAGRSPDVREGQCERYGRRKRDRDGEHAETASLQVADGGPARHPYLR